MKAVPALLVLILSLAAATPRAAAAPRLQDPKRARAYLAEVRKHLTESYIEREKVKGASLDKTGLEALAEACDHKDFADLPAETRARMRRAIEGADTLAAGIDAAADALGEERIDWLKFADHAARAMVKSVNDPYARILTRQDFTRLLKLLQGGEREDTIGLAIQPSEDGFEVAYVQYGYVAYDEGIEIGDRLVAVDGEKLAGRSPEEAAGLLKLKPGDSLTVTVRRPGHPEAYDFRIVQRRVKAKDVHYAMLGDGVGYLRMTVFDVGLQRQVERALESMKDDGMKSLIVDLRHNPGGMLPAATAVADVFLPQGLVITKVDMHYRPSIFGFQIPGLGGDQEYRTKTATDFEDMPMRVLVNGASASASELLAGALQDHKRGKLVGEKTYGKGVGQTPILLPASGGGFFPERYLYLTVLRYYLPTGRSIDHIGVKPDLAYPTPKPEAAAFAKTWKVRTSKTLADYVSSRWESHKDEFERLARYDKFEAGAYPGFDELYGSLKTDLSRDAVRAEVRRAVRKRLADEGEAFVHDLQTDVQLQYALVDLLEGR